MTEEEAYILERKYIQDLNSSDPDYGYNNSLGGDGSKYVKVSDLTKKRMSESRKGHEVSQSTRDKISERLTGNTNPSGTIRSEETKRKMSESKYKPVGAYDDVGNLVKVFRSALDAGLELGINRKNISLCCLNKRKHAGGYAWQFV